jgi:cytochrome c biogenesis protein CcdA
MVLVTGLWGALIAAAGGAFAGVVGSPQFMRGMMGVVLPLMGLVMLVIALGELGLIPRLLPDLQHALGPAAEARVRVTGGRYRQVAVLGLAIAATFAIVCTRPTYLALLVYVAAVGSVPYGVLALGAYGLGHALSLALSALGLRQASRSARLMDWLAARREAIHVAQGVGFAFLGAIPIWFFFLSGALGLG